jgi:hypothetical protein
MRTASDVLDRALVTPPTGLSAVPSTGAFAAAGSTPLGYTRVTGLPEVCSGLFSRVDMRRPLGSAIGSFS